MVVVLVEARSVTEGAGSSALETGGTLGDVASQVFRVREGAGSSALEDGGTLGDVAKQVFRDDKLTEVTDKVVTEMGEVVKAAAGHMGFSENKSTSLKEDEGNFFLKLFIYLYV